MINYIRGYYTLTIEGQGGERFLNYLIQNRVKVYNIKRIDNTKIELCVDILEMKKFRRAYKGSNYKIIVRKKTGLPFLAFRVYKQKVLWIGAIVSLMLLLMTTRFVTDIYIDAPEGIDKQAVMQELHNVGLKPGTYTQSIDRKEVREYIMSVFPEIAYVSINVEGTNIFVTVTKKSENIASKENSNYCNIIATKNGIIEEVITRSGKSQVEAGSVVTEGSLLVTGANTQSLPEVWATTFYEVEKSKSYEDVLKEKTGESKKVYTISFYDKEFTLRKNIDYASYEIENKEYKLSLFDYTFPITIRISTFNETKETKIELDQEKLKEELKQDALKELDYIIPVSARYIDVEQDYTVDKNMLKYRVTVKTSEDIAKIYPLDNSQAQKIVEEEKKATEGEQHNQEKRPINDIRNKFEEKEEEKENKENS